MGSVRSTDRKRNKEHWQCGCKIVKQESRCTELIMAKERAAKLRVRRWGGWWHVWDNVMAVEGPLAYADDALKVPYKLWISDVERHGNIP
jgi:hypothetical protein